MRPVVCCLKKMPPARAVPQQTGFFVSALLASGLYHIRRLLTVPSLPPLAQPVRIVGIRNDG